MWHDAVTRRHRRKKILWLPENTKMTRGIFAFFHRGGFVHGQDEWIFRRITLVLKKNCAMNSRYSHVTGRLS